MQKLPLKPKTNQSSLIIKNKLQFEQALSQLRATLNSFDEKFLMKLSQTIQLKSPIFSQQISSIVVVISLAAIKTKKAQILENEEICGYSILRIEQLSDIITEQKDEICLKMVEPEMVGWTSKIWDRLVHSSCFRNFIDLLVLYFFIGDSLLEYEKELKRLAKLLLTSFSKIKMISGDTLDLTIFILSHFIQLCVAKNYSFDLKVRLKILKILYLSKLENPNQDQIKVILQALKEFKDDYLQSLTDFLSKNQESSYTKEEDLIWDSLFMTVLRTFHRKKSFQPLAFKLITQMLNFRIDMQTVKLMIRELDVNDQNDPLQKWKNMFSMLYTAMQIYDKPRNMSTFITNKSYIRIPLQSLKIGNNFTLKLQIKNSWKTYIQEKFMVMIQDKLKKEQLWITTINQNEGEIKIIMLKVINKNIIEPTQQIVPWNQNKTAKINISFCDSEIRVQVNDMQNKEISIKRFMSQPSYLIIGDCDGTLGTSVKAFSSLSIGVNSSNKDEDMLCYNVDVNSKLIECKGVRKKIQPSYIEIFKALGDLDIFLLIVSHAFKRMKTHPDLTNMIRFSLKLMEGFVKVKKVDHRPLRQCQRDERLNAILCLCWQCSHETKNCLSVLQLLRVLTIRGIPNRQDQLEVLCNFVFWKTFEWQYQKIMLLKIKQLFVQYRYEQNNLKYVHKYSKILLMQILLYYRQQDCFNIIQQKQSLLKMHFQFFNLLQQEMSYQIQQNKQINLILDFMEYVIKALSMTISRKTYHNIEVFDLTISYHLSALLVNLSNLMGSCENKDKIFRIVKFVLQVCFLYNKEQCYFQDKQIVIYVEDEGENKKKRKNCHSFKSYQQNSIKHNLHYFAYRLISICPNLIYELALIQEQGIGDIVKIVWQKKFFDRIDRQCKQNGSVQDRKIQKVQKLKIFYDKMPKKYLSFKQNKTMIKLYLTKDELFPRISQSLSRHLWKSAGLNQTLIILKQQLFKNSKEDSQKAQGSKLQGAYCRNLSLFKKKILHMLAVEPQISGNEGAMIITTMKLLFPSYSSDEMIYLNHHFVLKNLINKLKNMHKNEQNANAFKSCIEVDTKPSSQISQDSSNSATREDYTQCLQFYLSRVNIRSIMQIKNVTNNEEGQGHLQNCKNQLTLMMNYLACYNMNSTNELKKYDSFLNTQILPFSIHLLQRYYKKVEIEEAKLNSPHKTNSFPLVDLQGEARNMYQIFMDQRNLILLKVQKTWHRIEQRNKYFWNTFLLKDTVYSLYEGTGMMNQRYILKKKNKKQKLQLPRMHKTSILKSASVFSQKLQFNESQSVSSIFDDAHLYRKDPNACMRDKREMMMAKEGRLNKFNVLLITSSKIYQGMIVIANKKLTFTQNETINDELYSKVCASECEKRSEEECILQNYRFEEELTINCRAISKRYLFHDIALQLHANNRSYLFSFMKKDYRKACLFTLEKFIKVLHREHIQEEIRSVCSRWEFGEISNYQYLMKLNDLSGRSFNDLSQYYIFPWTVTNFQDKIDSQFFSKQDNFRDLYLPIGKLNKSKWQTIKSKYQRTKKQQIIGIQPFLFGSFYSNPAIVSNFLIRINPFASQHFQLQSHSFDLPDRLFYSIKDSYQSLMQCSSDFKELIPQFYFFPQFLKNRNQYNLGLMQNKDIVNNVILPSWAQDQYQFVFRMRKFLECQHVSTGLHDWIDLIFGVYAKKEYALRADNLFLDALYIDSFKVYADEKDKECILYFKEFGQVPVSVFKSNHKKMQYSDNFLDLLTDKSNQREQCSFRDSDQCGRFMQILYSKRFTFILFQKQIRMYIDDKFGDKKYISQNGDFQGGCIKLWQMTDEQNKTHFCLLFHRKKTFQLLGYQIRKNLLNNYVFQGGDALMFKHRIQHFNILNNILICSQGKNIYIYKNIQQEIQQQYSTKNSSILQLINKVKYLLAIVCQFTQHKSRIIALKATESGMMVSIDEESKVYISEIHGDSIQIYNYFQIRSTCFQEKIVEIIVQGYGFIIIRTDYQRLLAFTFLGDKIVDQILHFKKTSQKQITQKMQCMHLWNKDFIELVVGTNKGNLWKIDLFAIKKCQEIEETEVWIQKLELYKNNSMKERIIKVGVNRIGRHFIVMAYGQNNKLYVQKSSKWDQVRKYYLSGKKNVRS